VTRRRLDAELVRRGLVANERAAIEAVKAGTVRIAGSIATKPATLVAADTPLQVVRQREPYVSRGGAKLAAALERFAIDPSGSRCLDAGSSTGGFTGVLLDRGAAAVISVDVGYGQLAWALRTDPRVTVMERTNVRDLASGDLPYIPSLLVADLSFTSLRSVLPSLARLAVSEAAFVVLVKPQFEAPRDDVGDGGVVRDRDVWSRAVRAVIAAGHDAGLGARGVMVSPLPGAAGNIEFLLHLERGIGAAVDVEAAIRGAEELQG
jgi:23S rRNA (cytidine1920-2'-O)/16S rRNA (cytidine1409-2'-O)-methyltransferase